MIKPTILITLALLGACLADYEDWEGRIVGGQNLTDDEIYPYMVSIRHLDKDSHYCGGSIISTRTVLTAAHCINHTVVSNVAVIAGTNYWNETSSRYRAQELITHPDYNFTEVSNDVGLVIVNREIVYTPSVHPIEISSETMLGGENAFYTGWGLTKHNGTLSHVLKYLDVTTITNGECAFRMGEFGELIFDGSLCTLAPFGDGVCNSDSGSPLVYDNRVIGFVSWVYTRCAAGYPDVSVRISSYVDWIQSNLIE